MLSREDARDSACCLPVEGLLTVVWVIAARQDPPLQLLCPSVNSTVAINPPQQPRRGGSSS